MVRYHHPTDPNVLASGSLDHQVRVWNATTAECVVCFDFAKPIASLAFHAEGDVLAVIRTQALHLQLHRSPHWRPAPAAAARAGKTPTRPTHPPPRRPRRAFPFVRYLPLPRPRLHRRRRRRGRPVRRPEFRPVRSLRTRRSLRARALPTAAACAASSPAEVNETSEQDVPPLRATWAAPRPRGEWEKAYAAAASPPPPRCEETPRRNSAGTPRLPSPGSRAAARDVHRAEIS